jgi:hypothetical protein
MIARRDMCCVEVIEAHIARIEAATLSLADQLGAGRLVQAVRVQPADADVVVDAGTHRAP